VASLVPSRPLPSIGRRAPPVQNPNRCLGQVTLTCGADQQQQNNPLVPPLALPKAVRAAGASNSVSARVTLRSGPEWLTGLRTRSCPTTMEQTRPWEGAAYAQ
jgi:hypothetical protein